MAQLFVTNKNKVFRLMTYRIFILLVFLNTSFASTVSIGDRSSTNDASVVTNSESKVILIFCVFAFVYRILSIVHTKDHDILPCETGVNLIPTDGQKSPEPEIIGVRHGHRATDTRGCPAPSLTATLTVGPHGNALLQDANLIEHLAHFNRERIAERSVHAKGAGAFGYFKLTRDFSEFTKAKLFHNVGKITRMLVRFSTTIGESGSADAVQDGRGFALKFYTEEDGNWDLVGNSIRVFQMRDPILFPLSLHSRKRNPSTFLHDPNARWDFDGLRPETVFHTMFQQSGIGSPDGYRHMDGFGVHTFKLVNHFGKQVYCKFHYKTDQGIKNLTTPEASKKGLDYAIEDLYNAIAAKKFPSWSFYVQIMTFEEARKYRWNPFDVTKLWLEKDFPLIKIGQFVLDRNPVDYFTQVEKAGFAVSNMIPGIEPSPDKMLHGRMFAYSDAIRQRLGANSNLIEVNRPLPSVRVKTYFRDGMGCLSAEDNGNGATNYFPNSVDGVFVDPAENETVFHVSGDVVRADTGAEDNFSQPGYYWRNHFDHSQRKVIIDNIVSTLKLTHQHIQKRVVHNFAQVDGGMGKMLRAALSDAKSGI